jgi:hypothetical protein
VGLFSTAFAAATATPEGQMGVFMVVDITFPYYGLVRWTEETPASGTYRAGGRLIEGVGAVSQSLSQRPSDLGLQTVSFKVADTDFAVSKMLAGRYNCRRSPVTIRWGHPAVAETDWFASFTGILDDWSAASSAVTINATTDDRPLQGFVERRQVLKGWAPYCPADVLGTYVPVVLGSHDANGLTVGGQIPLVPYAIDSGLGWYKYVVSLGCCKAVNRVYKGSTLLTVTTNYTVQQESLGGMWLTTVYLVGGTTATATDVITADVDGLTDTNLTTGAVITNPADLLSFAIVSLIYNNWDGVTQYDETDAPIDATSFSAAGSYFSTFKGEGAYRLGGTKEQQTGLALVNSWLKSHLMVRARWSNAGTIGLKVIDHRWSPYSYDYLVRSNDVNGAFGFGTSASDIISKVAVEYLYGDAPGKYWQRLETQDLARWEVEKVSQSYSLAWSSSRFQ